MNAMNVTELREARAKGLRPSAPGANLRGAYLMDAEMEDANLRGANLRHTDLRYADLRDANLWGANLADADWDGLQTHGLPSGDALLIPTPDGWRVRVGCWSGTLDALAEMVAGDDWPKSEGEEIARRRPGLEAWIALCRAHIAANPDVVPALSEKWGAA